MDLKDCKFQILITKRDFKPTDGAHINDWQGGKNGRFEVQVAMIFAYNLDANQVEKCYFCTRGS